MKHTQIPTRTPEQLEARKKLESLFGDLLAPVGKVKKEAKAKTPAEWKQRAFPSNPQTSPFFLAEHREYFLVEQNCLSCGSRTTYAETKMLRYKAIKRKDGLAIEIPCLLPAPLDVPSCISRRSESTDFCAHCVEIAARLDSSTLFELATPGTQLPLFN